MTSPALSQAEAFARIRMLRSPNIGPISYFQLLGRFGNAVAALDALPELGSRSGRKYSAAPTSMIEKEIEATRKAGAKYLFHDADHYPAQLSAIASPPPILTFRGDSSLFTQPSVSIVGARNASAAAIKLAREFARALADEGFTIVSGLARGIDGAAHEGAFPATIGVIASGIDISYPPEHTELQERIANEGLLLAEQVTGTHPRASHFPSRNRIIAGLTNGTLVVEAAPKSGSLITARLAGEAGREVMAIPGSPLDSRAQGCNQLIRDGAILVQTPEEVAELLTSFDGTLRSHVGPMVREEGGNVFEWAGEELIGAEPADITSLLSNAPVTIDELVRQSGEEASSVQMALLELEISGMLTRHAGGKVSMRSE